MTHKPFPFRHSFVWIAFALVAALLGGCASEPARQLGLSKLAVGEAEKSLVAGIDHYEKGRYGPAMRDLLHALDQGLRFTSDAVQAHKHLAFIHCISGRPGACRASFDEALKLDPRFELSRAEIGHPMWGPVFDEAKRASEAAHRSR